LVALLTVGTAKAQDNVSVVVNVPGTAGPWNWVNRGLNTNYQYGINDQTPPVVLTHANGFWFYPGGILTFTYISGLVTAAPCCFPYVDANGDLQLVANNYRGSSGKYFPSYFIDHNTYPIYLVELVGTFVDSSGAIVGTPFKIGDIARVVIPPGATQLQIGANDDIFHDNVGSWEIQISQRIAPCSDPIPSCQGVITIFNTGEDDNGMALPVGVLDPHYSLISAPPGVPLTAITTCSIVGVPNQSTADWIGPGANCDTNWPVGTYDYQTTFSLAGFDPNSAQLFGEWTSRNEACIYLNGTNTNICTPHTSNGQFYTFSITSGFRAGANTLDFVVQNEPYANPTGVIVEIIGTANGTAP